MEMGVASAANAVHIVNTYKKMDLTVYQPFMFAILGGISLNPCAGWSSSDRILTRVGMQLSMC